MATKTVITCDRCQKPLNPGLFAKMGIARANLAEIRRPAADQNPGPRSMTDPHRGDPILHGTAVREHDMCSRCCTEYRTLVEAFFSAPRKMPVEQIQQPDGSTITRFKFDDLEFPKS